MRPVATSRHSVRRIAFRGAVLVALAMVAMAWSGRGADRVSATVIVPASVQQQFTGAGNPAPDPSSEKASRPIYPMSVIPGGAYSVAELKAYLKSDPVARQSFEVQARRTGDARLLDHLSVRRVAKPTRMYSQLRKGAKLCYTAEPVVVQPGESGFYHDDTGDLVARSRCGNIMVVTVPARGMRVPTPPPQPIGWTTPAPPVVGVAGESGAQPPPPAPQQQQQQMAPVPPPQVPTITIPAPPPIVPPPPPTPPIIIPPHIPPSPPSPQSQKMLMEGGGRIPWWGLIGGGLIGSIAGRTSVHVKQSQHQQQKQKQKQKQEDTEPIPEPGTMLLMTLGLGAAGGLFARKRRKQ